MEHNNTINSTFAKEHLRDITDNELDALLHFDSPPLTLRFSNNSQEQQSGQQLRRTNDKPVDNGDGDANDDANGHANYSILQFNREPLPSQMDSQIDSIHDIPNDLDLSLSFFQNSIASRSHSVIICESLKAENEINLVDNTEINNVEPTTNANADTNCHNSQIPASITRSENSAEHIGGDGLRSRTPTYQPSQSQNSIDEIIKKELLVENVLEDFWNDDDFAIPPDCNSDHEPRQDDEVARRKGVNLKRLCQTQTQPKFNHDPIARPIFSSCPVPPARIAQSPSLPSTISGGNRLSLSASTQSDIQMNAMDYTLNQIPNNTSNNNAPVDCREQSSTNGGSSLMTKSTVYKSSTADCTMVPASVKQLYDLVHDQYSDFAFVYALSAQLCQERVPMDCYVNLKLALLLSLVSICSNLDRPPIPIMAFGTDTYMANFLLTNVGQLAARFAGPAENLKPPSTSHSYLNCKWLEADPIVLAKGGVYFVGDWSGLKLARADQLFRIVESATVPISSSTQTYKLETAIWAHWRSSKSDAREQQTFNKVVKIFGLLICMDDDDKHEVLLDYILEQSSVKLFESTIDHLSISSDDMRCFLKTISKRTVDLTTEALELLQKYFVTTRFSRPECLTKQAFVVLKQFAESFAKLCLRHEVLVCDAVAAIFMYERFINSTYGVNENSPPAFESHNYIGSVDEYMLKFQEWLNAYVRKYQDK